MKYIKGNQIGKIDDFPKGKIRLTDGDDFTETPWVGKIPNSQEVVLLNHALAFTPHESWGAILPDRGRLNFLEMLESQELTLHPEAWEAYIEYEIIDMDGKYIKHTAKAKSLLLRLGIKSYSVRHLKMIEDFLKEGDKDLRGLLTGLGDWDENDLLVAEAWFKEM